MLPRYLAAVINDRADPSYANGATTDEHHNGGSGRNGFAGLAGKQPGKEPGKQPRKQVLHGDPPRVPHTPHRIGISINEVCSDPYDSFPITGSETNLQQTAAMTRSSRKATVGSPAPAIDLEQADGTRWKLAEATKNGPVVLVFLRGFF